MTKKILITGGLGFIGVNLVKNLLDNSSFKIRILSQKKSNISQKQLPFSLNSNRVEIIFGSILEKHILKKAIKDTHIIVHLASKTSTENTLDNAESILETNVNGTHLLLQAAESNKEIEKIILLSSAGVYGESFLKKPVDELANTVPLNVYSVSKLASERLSYLFYYYKKMPIVILRPFNVYGPYQTLNKPVPLFITRLLKDKKIILNHEGKQLRDWVYVDDLVDAIRKVIFAPNKKVDGQVFNIATGIGISIHQVASKILSELKMSHEKIEIAKNNSNEPMYSVGSPKKIQNILNWKPKYNINRGTHETVRWYKYNTSLWENDLKNISK